MPLTASLLVQLSALLSNTTADLMLPSAPFSWARQFNIGNGTGANQADRMFVDSNTLAASGTANIDLAGSLTDVFGAALTFARIKLVAIAAAEGNTNDVQVTRPASNGSPLFLAAGDGLSVRPGGMFLWVAPDAVASIVTAGTGDLLTFTNSAAGSSVTYEAVIIGASA